MTRLLRIFGLVSLAVHRLEIERRDERILGLADREHYWRSRAEKLMDAALSRAGAIYEPTMRETKIPTKASDLGAMITSAMAITEIDSQQGKAAPTT